MDLAAGSARIGPAVNLSRRSRTMLTRALTGITMGILTLGVSAAVARADGLPVLGFEGGASRGVASIDGQARYLAHASRRTTRIARLGGGGRPRGAASLNAA